MEQGMIINSGLFSGMVQAHNNVVQRKKQRHVFADSERVLAQH
jgi:hypothetical protein